MKTFKQFPGSKNKMIFVLIFFVLCLSNSLFATVTILKATGGTSISADKAANAPSPVYTTVGNIRLTEGAFTDFAVGSNVTYILNAPTGWSFNTAAPVTVTFTAARDITSATILTFTTTAITVELNIGSTSFTDVLTVSGVQVMANDGANVTGAGNITKSGTAAITGCATGANLGTLSQSPGAIYRLAVTLPGQTLTDATTLAGSGFTGTVTNQTAGTNFNITRITAIDRFYNRVTSYSGAKTITYTGPSNGLTAPTFTTAVTFASGRSSTTLVTNLKKAETTTITVTDGVNTGLTSSNLLVNPGVLNNFLVESTGGGNIPSNEAGTSFTIQVTARDAQNNTCSSGPSIYTGTVNITSNGTLSSGGGTTPAFVAGFLASRTVTVTTAGNITITATRTSGGVQSGTSNSFTINPAALNNFLVEGQSGGNIGSQTIGNPFNIKVTARDIYNNTCGSGANNFTGTVDITSTGTLSSGSGTTATFTAGVLSSHGVTISNGGNFTITATRTSGVQTGTSNSFSVNNPLPSMSDITPDCKTTGGIAFTLTVNGSNFISSSVVRVNGANRITTFINSSQLQASILAADISSAGIKLVDVQNPAPGGGTSSTANLVVGLTPVINTQPLPQSLCEGQPASFSVSVTGQALSYTWMKNGIALTNGGNISGANTSTLTINPVGISDVSNSYYVRVSSYCYPDIYSDTVSLDVLLNSSSTANISICDGQSYTPPGGTAQTTSGTYISTIANATGCDSVITTNLTVIPNTSSTADVSICVGQSYTPPGGSAETTSGTYITHISNAAGCDSTITTNLTVNPNSSSTANVTICNGYSYTPPGGSAETTSGTYITHISNAAGCDSAITTNLTVVNNVSTTQNMEICLGDSVVLPDLSVVYPTVDTDYVSTYSSISVPGCDSLAILHIIVNPIPVLTATPVQIQCTGSTGSVNLSAVGGTPSYTYGGASTTNLSPGTYNYTVTDSKGCMDGASAIISAAPPALNLSATSVQIGCFGQRGSVTLNTTGGVPAYTYNGTPTTNLVAGTYLYTVTDANGCTDSATAVINPEPAQLILTATANQIVCYLGRGSVTLSATGGTAPYVYNNTPTTNLASGIYTYIVTDSRGCTANTSALIGPSPSRLTGITSSTATRCDSNTGTASITASGGSAPYTFSWNTTPVQTTPQATGLAQGIYVVNIVDGHGCTASAQATVSKAASTPVTITGKNGTCPNEFTSLCATNGLTSYLWSNGDATRCSNIGTPGTYTVVATNSNGCTSSASKTLTGGTTPAVTITGNDFICPGASTSLCASPGLTTYTWNNGLRAQCRSVTTGGTYSVVVTNTSGCTASASLTVKSPFILSSKANKGVCSNGYQGNTTVNVNGTTSPYTYSWNNGATTQSITDLNAGTYVVTVTDVNGCTATSASTVTISKLTSDYSNINSNFNSVAISPGTYIWFSAVVSFNYGGTYPVTLSFTNQSILSSKFTLTPPNAKLVITNAVSQASTTFDGTEWITTAPPNLTGQYFISGYAHLVPLSITPNLNPVTWKGIWTSSEPGFTSLTWKWSAACYSAFAPSLDLADIKPVDDNSASPFVNADLAGSPENYTVNCIAGARSMGSPNFTGNYSNSASRTPCSPPAPVLISYPQTKYNEEVKYPDQKDPELVYKAFPNPFSSIVTIELERTEKASNTVVEIYNAAGQRISTLLNEMIDPNKKYSLEYNAENLPEGIYIYKIVSGNDVINGKLILRK